MRYSHAKAGLVGLMGAALTFSWALAGPLDRDATSKALGDYTGRAAIANQENQPSATRAFSYAPQAAVTPAPAAPAVAATVEHAQPVTPAKPNVQSAQGQSQAVRSFSYQAPVSYAPANRANLNSPRYDHAERKALGQY